MVLTFANHCHIPKEVCTGEWITASVCSYHCQTYLPIGKSLPNSSSDFRRNISSIRFLERVLLPNFPSVCNGGLRTLFGVYLISLGNTWEVGGKDSRISKALQSHFLS